MQQAGEIICRNFDIALTGQALPSTEQEAFSLLKEMLAKRIADLIDHDFERLLQILYRIDVPENKAKLALADHPVDEAPGILAALIIERQLEKVKTWQQHQRQDNDADDGEERW